MDKNGEELSAERESAERELRRGNFKSALETYESLLRRNPGDEALANRLRDLKELLQPMELTHPKAAAVSFSGTSSVVHEAEAAANRGDIRSAIAGYESLLAKNPDNLLYQERYDELMALASDPVMAGAMPRSRSVPPRPTPTFEASSDPAIPTMARSAPGRQAKDPAPPTGLTPRGGLPWEPVALLEELLARIARNRRPFGIR